MALSNFKKLSTEDKLLVLHTTAGLQQLNEWLSKGHSLRHVAEKLLDLDSRTLYRWIARYPDIAELVALYKPVKTVIADPVLCQPRDATYRIICAYEDHNTHLKGAIYGEYETP